MNQIPYFSIIIPTYNRSSILSKGLNLIKQQTFTLYEIIIVDDGSTDNTEEIISNLNNPNIRYFKTENRERSHARNVGLKYAQGKYVNYFDSDDIMYPERLQMVYDYLQSNTEPDVVFTHYDFVNEENQVVGRIDRHFKSFTKDLLFNNFLATNAVFLKQSVALKFPFHEDRRIITAEDWELWLRVHAVYDFHEYPVSTFAIKQHAGRSLATIPAFRILQRDSYFVELIDQNSTLLNKIGKKAINLFKADRYTFIALTLATENNRKQAVEFLARSLKVSPHVVIRKRFWAVLKKLL